MIAQGVAALLCWALHAADLASRGELQDLLWHCNVATLVLGVALIARWPRGVAVCAMVLAAGLPQWLIGLATPGVWLCSSLLTHVVALGLAVRGVRALGMPPGTWWRAALAMAALIAAARVLTDPARNVNLAHAIWPGFERHAFGSHALYLSVLAMLHAAAFLGAERLARACSESTK